MRTKPNDLYMLVRGDFYEPISMYRPRNEDYLLRVRDLLPDDWINRSRSIFAHFRSPSVIQKPHGWKIHVSATEEFALDTALRVVPILVRANVPFKIIADRRLLRVTLGKSWDRGSSGKFITIYPPDETVFLRLLPELNAATSGLIGPFVLSDRRYLNSGCVFYRYGSILPREEIRVDGRISQILDSPNGERFTDVREPFYRKPPWVDDIVPYKEPPDDNPPGTIGCGRYVVERVIKHSNSGGVYVALDKSTNNKVLVKEARPGVSPTPSGKDALVSLRKEYRLLKTLDGTECAPRAIDYFTDWEHEYLVEEYLEGMTLREITPRSNILLNTVLVNDEDHQLWYYSTFDMMEKAAETIRKVHEHGIIFGDISPNNIFVLDYRAGIRLIDFEGASQIGIDESPGISTPGFRKLDDISGSSRDFTSDYYALAAVMLCAVFPLTSYLELDRTRIQDIVVELCSDARVPERVSQLLVDVLTEKDLGAGAPENVIAVLRTAPTIRDAPVSKLSASPQEIKENLSLVCSFILACGEPIRADRLLPGDYRIYQTNALSYAYGALGTISTMLRVGEEIPSKWIDWVEQRIAECAGYAPGWSIGQAGCARGLWDCGLEKAAVKLLSQAHEHRLLRQNCGLSYGRAGVGLTDLRFFRLTADELHLKRAIDIAESLSLDAEDDGERKLFWRESHGEGSSVHLGLMHGGSGIAIFFLSLYIATRVERYLDIGERALQFDLSNNETNKDGAFTWPYTVDFRLIRSPYYEYGSAGVGSAVLRYALVTGKARYWEVYDKIFLDTHRKYTLLSGMFMGLSGLGCSHLDAYSFTGLSRYRDAALRAYDGVMILRVARTHGLGFIGSSLNKLSCDYAYGSAGVAEFFDRLATGRSSDFFLDQELREYLSARDDMCGLASAIND